MDGLRRGRRWRFWLILSLSVGIYYGAVQQSLHGLLSHERWNWTDMAIYGGVWAVIWLPVQLLGQSVARTAIDRGWIRKSPARRRLDRAEQLIKPAIEAGMLPRDAQSQVWGPALLTAAQEVNSLRWVMGAGLTIVAGLVGASAALVNDNALGIWVLAAVVVAEGAVAYQLPTRRLRVIRGLLAQLPRAL